MCKSDNKIGGSTIVLRREEQEVDAKSTDVGKTTKDIGVLVRTPSIGEKLFQAKEDRMYFHKIIGFSVLASYAYRFSQFGERDGSFSGIAALVFVAHHASLNLSSFVFHIPHRRIRGGFRIWPEYRIHSMVFTFRNLACMLRLWVLLNTAKEDDGFMYSLWNSGLVNWIIVIATCAAADYGSSLSAQYHSNTVRGTDYFDPYANWFASEMQFQLTAVCLSGVYQRYTLHIVGAFIIQFNSFLMTLRRKNVFSHLTLTTTYGLMLAGSMFLGAYEDNYTNDHITEISTFANLGVMLRMGLGVDKYIVWTILAAGMYAANSMLPPLMEGLPREPYFYWLHVFWVTKFICFGLGLRRRSQVLQKRRLAEEKDKASPDAPPKAGNEVVLSASAIFSIMATYEFLEVYTLL